MKRKLEENQLPFNKIVKEHHESNQCCCLLDLNYSSNLLSSKIADIPHKLKYETILAPIFEYCFGTSDQDQVWEEVINVNRMKYESEPSSLSIINLKIDWIRDETFLYSQIFNLSDTNLIILAKTFGLQNNRKFILASCYSTYSIIILHSNEQYIHDRELVMELLKKSGINLQYACEELKNDKEIVQQALKQDGNALEFVSEELRNDKEIVKQALKNNGLAFAFASEELRNDKEFVLLAFSYCNSLPSYIFKYSISKRLRNDRDVVFKAVSLGLSVSYVSETFNNDRELLLMCAKNNGLETLELACLELRNDKELLLKAIKQRYHAFKLASDELKNDKEFLKKIVMVNSECFKYASKELKDDREIVELVLKSYPDAIYYISDSLRKDTQFISTLIGKRGFKKLPEEFSNDREIVLESIKLNAENLNAASMELQNDREFILQVVKNNGKALYCVKKEFKSDTELIMESVKQWGRALEYLNAEFKSDREIIMEAVTQNGDALHYAPDQYFDDKEIILKAVENITAKSFFDTSLFYNFSERLKNDRELLMKCGVFFEYYPRKYQLDREIVMECLNSYPSLVLWKAYPLIVSDRVLAMRIVKRNGLLLETLDSKYRNDREIVSFAIQQNTKAFKYASSELKNDSQILKLYNSNN